MSKGLLEGVRVVEFASSIPAAYCGKVLAELGAEVVKVEPPEGDWLRRRGPFIGDPHPDRSASFHYYAAGKHSVVLDPSDLASAVRLVDGAAVVLADSAQDALPVDDGWRGVWARFTGMGHPERDGFDVTDIVAYALGGYLYTDGAADRSPLKGGGEQPAHAAGNYAILAVLSLLFASRIPSHRIDIDVPTVECMATMHWYTTVMWTYDRLLKHRIGNRLDITHPVSLYACADGWVAIGAGGDDAWAMLCTAIGQPEAAADPRFSSGANRLQHADEVDALITSFTSRLPRIEVMRLLQELRVPCGLVSSPTDLLADPQYQSRDYWVRAELDGGRELKMPGPPFRSPAITFRSGPAPTLAARAPGMATSASGSSRGSEVSHG